MQQKSPYIWFSLAVVFVLLAFTWWTYSLVSLKTLQYNTLLELIEKEALTEDLLLEVEYTTGPLHSSDTIYLDSRAGAFEAIRNWPEAYLLIKRGRDGSLHVMANPALMEKIRALKARKALMYISEGVVFFILVSIAIWWVFRSLSRIVSLNQQQNNFMLSVTHELKTPIASVKLALQSLLRRELPIDKQREILNQALSETERLNNLIEDILTGIRIEDAQSRLMIQNTDLSELIRDSLSAAQKRYNGSAAFTSDLEKEITTQIDPTLFNLAFNNLIDNAVKYSKEKAEVSVELLRKDNDILIRVMDRGQGIPSHERKNVIRKFYRTGNEENRSTKGTGLGLYLTNEIVKRHGGKLLLEDNNPRGTIATIKLHTT